jgi:PAS domain S-box-containing protein
MEVTQPQRRDPEEAGDLFLTQPVPTLLVDLRPLYVVLQRVNAASPLQFETYLRQHPEPVTGFLGMLKVLAANPAAVALVEAPDEQAFIEHFPHFFTAESLRPLRPLMQQLADGREEWVETVPICSWGGRKLCVQFFLRPLTPGDLSRVICNFFEVTAWKRAEAAMQREQKALMGSPVFSFRWRNAPGWPVESVSPNIVELGYTQEELLSGATPYARLVHPEDLERVGAEVARYSATGQGGFEQEYRVVSAGGEVRWTYDYTSIVRDPNGEITHYDGYIIDITSRKLAEQALRASEQRYQEMFESNAVSIWLEDISRVIPVYEALRRQGVSDFRDYFQQHPELIFELAALTRVIDINAATLGLFEAESKGELLGALEKVFCAESLAGSIELHTALAEGQRSFEVETVNQTLKGNLRHILIKINLAAEADYSKVLVTLVDITSRKQAQELLTASETELETIYNQLLDTYYRTDSEGYLRRLSPSVEQMLGYTPEEALGTKIADYYVVPDERNVFLRKLREGGGVLRNHFAEMRHKEGHVVWCLTNARVVYDSEGRSIGVEGTTRDVSDRHQLEQELRQARDMAEQASRLKSDFLANMSHEIRTPMNGVVGFVNLLSHTELSGEQRDYLDTMKSSMGDLMAIVNDILDLSRIESGKLALRRTEFDLLESVTDVVNLFSAAAEAKGLKLSMQVERTVPYTVEGDAVRLRQILANLIGNAVKFTVRGEVVLRVAVQSRRGEIFELRFEVLDSGIGIDEQRTEWLFDAFTQGAEQAAGGTGLGLAITRSLVNLMGGTITARNRAAGGACFTFTLPLRRLAQVARRQPLIEADALHSLRGRRVLVVDDNAINRKLISTLLGKMEVVTVEAEDGHQALATLETDGFDLVLMDIRMPGLNGVEATREIRRRESHPARIPIIALTAHAMPHESESFILAGMDDCLTKPVMEGDLVRLLRHYLAD